MELLGWISSIALSVCALPQVWYTIKTHDTSSFTWSFLWLWCLGDAGLLIYTWGMNSWALSFNYALNALAIGVILSFKVFNFLKDLMAQKA